MSNWSILDITWFMFGLALSCIAILLYMTSLFKNEKVRYWYEYITKRSSERTKKKEFERLLYDRRDITYHKDLENEDL